MIGQLGCGAYSARIVTRGALAVVWEELPFTTLDYERVLDDTSQANLTLDGVDEGCDTKAGLALVNPWVHELAIYRNTTRVWLGPIVQISAKGTSAKITARDRSVWWDHRFIHTTRDSFGDLATIFLAYFTDAMSPDPVAGFACNVTPTNITGERSVDALDHKDAGGEMRELSDLGIDWTVLDAVCFGGGRSVPAGRVPVLTDQHLSADPDVLKSGLAQVNRAIITGQQPQDDGTGQFVDGPRTYGEAMDPTRITRDGLLEANTQDDKADDAPSCAAGAASQLALNGDVPVVVSNLALAPEAPMTIEQLVPGVICDIELKRPAIAVSGLYRMQRLSVSVTNGTEAVSIDVQPVGTL